MDRCIICGKTTRSKKTLSDGNRVCADCIKTRQDRVYETKLIEARYDENMSKKADADRIAELEKEVKGLKEKFAKMGYRCPKCGAAVEDNLPDLECYTMICHKCGASFLKGFDYMLEENFFKLGKKSKKK